MKVWTKWVLVVIILSFLIGLGSYLAWKGIQRDKPVAALETPAVPVTVLKLQARDFVLTSRFSGKLEAVSDVTAIARVRGTVIDDLIREGQQVKKGQILYRLDDDSYRYAMLQAEAAVDLARENLLKVQDISRPEEISRLKALVGEAQAALGKARSDAGRYDELYREGAVSLSQKESADLALAAAEAMAEVADENLNQAVSGSRDEDIATARAAYAQAQAARDLAKDTWEDATIRSPISGIISSKDAFEGDTLEAGMPVCNVVDLSSFRIYLGVPGSEITGLVPGEKTSVTITSYEATYEAVIEDIGVKSDDRTGNFPVILRLDNASSGKRARLLRAGMDVKVSIVRDRVPNTLIIPTSALLRETNASVVFTVEKDIASKRVIHLGKGNEVEAVVSAGLNPGELLVVVGQHQLKTGDKVETALAR